MDEFTKVTIAGWALLIVILVLWRVASINLKKEEIDNDERDKQTIN